MIVVVVVGKEPSPSGHPLIQRPREVGAAVEEFPRRVQEGRRCPRLHMDELLPFPFKHASLFLKRPPIVSKQELVVVQDDLVGKAIEVVAEDGLIVFGLGEVDRVEKFNKVLREACDHSCIQKDVFLLCRPCRPRRRRRPGHRHRRSRKKRSHGSRLLSPFHMQPGVPLAHALARLAPSESNRSPGSKYVRAATQHCASAEITILPV